MLTIGLTGGIGAGKSTVSDLFAQLGAPVIDADVIARELTLPNTVALHAISEHFGSSILQPDGSLDRGRLRDIVFSDKAEREWLEKLLHPLIRHAISERISQISAPYCIVAIPLLSDTASYPFITRVLVVDASESTQIQRVVTRDKKSDQHVIAIIESQLNRAKRLDLAHDIIHNDGIIAELKPQVEKLHRIYTALGQAEQSN